MAKMVIDLLPTNTSVFSLTSTLFIAITGYGKRWAFGDCYSGIFKGRLHVTQTTASKPEGKATHLTTLMVFVKAARHQMVPVRSQC